MKWLLVVYHFVVVKKCSGYLRCTIMIANVCCLGGLWCTENVNLFQSVFFWGGRGGSVSLHLCFNMCGFLEVYMWFLFQVLDGVWCTGSRPAP